ncbi:hypothetical protein [uncultured Thiodictyon sp.]|uniref:hypothetical protein n=2 Tax=uncultured Thiodictyon sp. TaxID=1846217 RepID=UPI0025D8B9E7|nr:hypothetical protein [uncultured Thiodictyon sp.]
MDTTFWIVLAVLWLVSPVILFIAVMAYRSQTHRLREQLLLLRGVNQPPPTMTSESARPSVGGERRFARVDLENLLLLRLELLRQVELGALAAARCRRLTDALDLLWAWHLRQGGARPDNGVWEHRRAIAWALLAHWAELPIGAPPWQAPIPIGERSPTDSGQAAVSPPGPSDSAIAVDLPPIEYDGRGPDSPAPPPPVPVPVPVPAMGRKVSGWAGEGEDPWTQPAPGPAPEPASNWRPAVPSRLEQALQALSGWPALIAPFLVQNIGWFIGGFCFVAGALFLIANTSGFVNALVVFGSLFGSAAFLLWAGFQFRRQRPELAVASSMLLTLGMLLGPLVVAVAVRLIAASPGEGWLTAVGVLVAVATLGAFALAAALASALMDRALRGRYPWLLTALAAVQLVVPLAAFATGWVELAALHTLLLALLGYGLWTFSGEWLRRLFVDRQRTTYYAAGMLVYTALVSFVHLTWVWPHPLPAGYAGPFLMALCGLLLPVDAAFKEWVGKYAFLSRASFAIYGLSAVAVAVAVQSPAAAILTLAMGAVLYGWMTWRYRTLPPLYLLFGCVAGLYGLVILNALPPAWHGLASLPGLLALLGLARWAAARSRNLALQCLATFALLLCTVTLWSLAWTPLGAVSGVVTAATAALLAYVAVRLALRLPQADPRWANADVGAVVLATVAVAFMPDAWHRWELNTGFGLLALAALWTALGLHHRRLPPASRQVFIVAALLNVVLALGLGGLALWPDWLGRLEPILLLVPAGALLLWLGLGLRRQALLYGVLACAGAVGVLLKQRYAPGPGTGLLDFILVLVLWASLWRLAWRTCIRAALNEAPNHPGQPTAGLEPSEPPDVAPCEPPETSLAELIRAPLEQAMALLWAVGLMHLGLRLLAGAMMPGWPWIAVLALVSGVLVVGHFHLFRWVALPMLLGLAGLLVGLDRLGLTLPWLGAAAVLYALLVWRLSVDLLGRPVTGRLAGVLGFTVPGGAGGRRQVEDSLHAGALLVAALPVAAAPALVLAGAPTPAWLPTLGLSLLLFLLAGWHYRTELHAWAALATLTVGGWLTGAWLAPPALFVLGQPVLNGCLSVVLAVVAVGLEVERARPLGYWRTPLQWTSGLLYLLALGGAVLGALAGAPGLPLLLGLLCVALFPVARPLPGAAHWRGLGLALLASALVWALAVQSGVDLRAAAWIAVAWGYVLWAVGNLVLPRWNARLPGWAVAPTSWPLLGLASVLGGVTVGALAGAWSSAAALAGLTPYLFLLLANTAWPGLAWLAVAALAGSGLLAAGTWTWWDAGGGWPVRAEGVAVALLWLNLLFLLIPFWGRYGQRLAGRLSWRQDGLAAPLFWVPFANLVLLLAALLLVEAADWLPAVAFGWGRPVGWLSGLALLLAATAGHAWRLRPGPLTAQVLLIALAATVAAILRDLMLPPIWLPLAVALWDGVLLLAWRYGVRDAQWRAALGPWLTLLPLASLGLLVPLAATDWAVGTLSLWLLALAMLAQGWWQGSGFWLKAGFASALAGGYTAWLVVPTPMVGVLPWYALQTVLLLLALTAIHRRLASWLERVDPDRDGDRDANRFGRISEAEQAVSQLVAGLLALSLLWLGLHGWFVLAHQAGWGPLPWRFGGLADPLAAGAALLLLAGLAAVRAWRQPDAHGWVYAGALLLGLLVAYGRLAVLGLAPFTPWDTAALLAVAGATLLLHQFTGSWPVSRLALLLPALSLVTVHWQLASPWTGGALLAVAVLYLSQAATLRNPWPLYLGVLALNGAVYLWAPLWAAHYGLWQFYIVPAAVSVLVLLHLHRRELRPQVLSGARLAALSALYAGAGLDLFLRPELSVFVLALALALVGAILGIALRIRAFLYAGVAFLVLNVGGQLFRFYPGQGMGRALILIGLGAVITAGMVVFNLKREAILRRIRVARADLAQWE